jgi:HSP20 family protein
MADLKRWSQGEITRMRLEIDKLFDEFCSDFDLPAMYCRMSGDIELWEDGDVLIARLELYNIDPDDVSVGVFEHLLVVTARAVEVIGGHRHSRAFRKELKLPCAVRSDEVVAEFADGVLEIRLPKCAVNGRIIRIIKK